MTYMEDFFFLNLLHLIILIIFCGFKKNVFMQFAIVLEHYINEKKNK